MQTQIPGQWTALVEAIKELPGVQAANLWTRVSGKERIYADLTKHNGGKNWNGGVGHRVVAHLATRTVELDRYTTWAGIRTREAHEELGTIDAIRALVTMHLS